MSGFLNDLQRDAVSEIINIAVGQAAAALSQLVEDEVRLSVPLVHFLTPTQAVERLEQETGNGESVAVRQTFRGRFSGDILLIFPERRSLHLVRGMLGNDMPVDQLSELEREALLEVGNIILNACLGSLANQLGLAMESSLPAYLRGRGGHILEADAGNLHARSEIVMFLHVDFALKSKDVHGYLAFVMDIVSAQHFVDAVHAYVTAGLDP